MQWVEAAPDGLLFRLESNDREGVDIDGPATMDHRGLVAFQGRRLIVGAMLDDQQVTDTVISLALEESGD